MKRLKHLWRDAKITGYYQSHRIAKLNRKQLCREEEQGETVRVWMVNNSHIKDNEMKIISGMALIVPQKSIIDQQKD